MAPPFAAERSAAGLQLNIGHIAAKGSKEGEAGIKGICKSFIGAAAAENGLNCIGLFSDETAEDEEGDGVEFKELGENCSTEAKETAIGLTSIGGGVFEAFKIGGGVFEALTSAEGLTSADGGVFEGFTSAAGFASAEGLTSADGEVFEGFGASSHGRKSDKGFVM